MRAKILNGRRCRFEAKNAVLGVVPHRDIPSKKARPVNVRETMHDQLSYIR
jgi:hypothetical protein